MYGLTTFGNRDKNLSIGLGYGYADGSWATSPLINLSGMVRVSSRGYILTENYFILFEDFGGALLSFGGRTIIKRAGLDYGVFIPAFKDQDVFIAFPWLGITIPFGNKPKL